MKRLKVFLLMVVVSYGSSTNSWFDFLKKPEQRVVAGVGPDPDFDVEKIENYEDYVQKFDQEHAVPEVMHEKSDEAELDFDDPLWQEQPVFPKTMASQPEQIDIKAQKREFVKQLDEGIGKFKPEQQLMLKAFNRRMAEIRFTSNSLKDVGTINELKVEALIKFIQNDVAMRRLLRSKQVRKFYEQKDFARDMPVDDLIAEFKKMKLSEELSQMTDLLYGVYAAALITGLVVGIVMATHKAQKVVRKKVTQFVKKRRLPVQQDTAGVALPTALSTVQS